MVSVNVKVVLVATTAWNLGARTIATVLVNVNPMDQTAVVSVTVTIHMVAVIVAQKYATHHNVFMVIVTQTVSKYKAKERHANGAL